LFGSSFDWTGAPATQPAPAGEDLWAAPAAASAPLPVPTQQPAPASFVSSAAARDILPGR
jgi:hypothetical protein